MLNNVASVAEVNQLEAALTRSVSDLLSTLPPELYYVEMMKCVENAFRLGWRYRALFEAKSSANL